MTVASFFQENGLTVELRTQRVKGSVIIGVLTEKINSYAHVISADNGYDSANIGLSDTIHAIDDWIMDGLGREIYVYDPSGSIVWHGFVNSITVESGFATVQRGPLIEVANRVSVVYTPILDATDDPVITGEQTETTIAEDTGSQEKYGILEEIVSAGQALNDGVTNDAVEIRDTYLGENSLPQTSNNLSISPGSGGQISITIECLGYVHWFSKWIYNNAPVSPLSAMAYTKVEDVINSDPNGWFSSTNALIEQNAVLVPDLEDNNSTAKAVIDGIVQLGNGSFQRMTFGVYEDLKCVYSSIPTEYTYSYNVMSDTFYITHIGGGVINPWNVLPAKWVILPDFIVGSVSKDSPARTDPRALFIERVQYTAPYSIELSGEKVGTIAQKLARLGVGGL